MEDLGKSILVIETTIITLTIKVKIRENIKGKDQRKIKETIKTL